MRTIKVFMNGFCVIVGLLFHNIALFNPISAFDMNVFRAVAKMYYKAVCNLFIGS